MRKLTDTRNALNQYRRRAKIYDPALAAFEPNRKAAISRLRLQKDDSVFDVGRGSGQRHGR